MVSEPYEYWDTNKREGRAIMSLKHAALLAGMGAMGKNSLLTHPTYGNRLSFGAVLLPFALEPDPLCEDRLCPETCHRCEEACPVDAIHAGHVNQKRCRSHSGHTTPKGYALTTCTICRQVCPSATGARKEN
ncbi:hypothetical protein ACFL3F_04135 [Planctomycetota bacterium]